MLKTLQRTALALLGFVGGVLTAPIFALLWPFAAAFILWSEFDGDDDGDDDGLAVCDVVSERED